MWHRPNSSLFAEQTRLPPPLGKIHYTSSGVIFGIPAENEDATVAALARGDAIAMAISLKVNGVNHSVPAEPDTPLLYVLRNDLGLNGPKFGCGLGQCGCCTVLLDGEPARSCQTPLKDVGQEEVTTIEGLGTIDNPHPLQTAFMEEQAAQCGYCLNGMIISIKALLIRTPRPSETEVLEALRYNLCRCGAHIEIIRAAMRAAGALAEAQD